MYILSSILLATVLLGLSAAQQPFTVTGIITAASANPGTAINRGGSVTISGFNVVIPDNLLVEFPAAFVPFPEFVDGNKPGQNEVSITGNIINNVIIAGQMTYSQVSLAAASGIISDLDTDGSIHIQNGPVLRINDPRAIYSAGFTGLPLFTADDENPSITSFSGFPVCVPRSSSDPKCPASNRPPTGSNLVSDATHMVPLKVGDFIEYSGIQFNGQTIVYTLVANIDLLTSGSQPGFVRIEDAIIGVANADPNVEDGRCRFVGLASRSDLLVRIFAIDEDPCTGDESERLIASATPNGPNINKWKVDVPKGTNIGLITRNYRIRIGDNVVTTADGIQAGQYVQPVTDYIFPELITPGGVPPVNDFTGFGALKDGFGPINGTIFGQLKPWPGAAAPTPAKTNCPPPTSTTVTSAPTGTGPVNLVAAAGADQTVLGGVSVLLSASQTSPNIDPASLAFAWTQISGANVVLSATNTPSIRFPAPVVSGANVLREFRVVITHIPSGSKSNDTVVVTSVALAKNTFDNPVIDALTWATRQSGTATANAHSDLVDSSASMRVTFNGDNVERPMVRGAVNNGVASYSFSSRSIAKFTSATIKSYLNNVAVGGPVVSSTNVGAG